MNRNSTTTISIQHYYGISFYIVPEYWAGSLCVGSKIMRTFKHLPKECTISETMWKVKLNSQILHVPPNLLTLRVCWVNGELVRYRMEEVTVSRGPGLRLAWLWSGQIEMTQNLPTWRHCMFHPRLVPQDQERTCYVHRRNDCHHQDLSLLNVSSVTGWWNTTDNFSFKEDRQMVECYGQLQF